jgi:hypothetical protein
MKKIILRKLLLLTLAFLLSIGLVYADTTISGPIVFASPDLSVDTNGRVSVGGINTVAVTNLPLTGFLIVATGPTSSMWESISNLLTGTTTISLSGTTNVTIDTSGATCVGTPTSLFATVRGIVKTC